MQERIICNIQSILKEEKTEKILSNVFKEISFSGENKFHYFISFPLGCILSALVTFMPNVIDNLQKIVEMMNGIELAFIAMIVGAFAIYQALLRDEFIRFLVKTENNMLKTTNQSFLNWILLFTFAIILNIILNVFLITIPKDFLICHNVYIADMLCFILLLVYFLYNLLVIMEIKSFAINLYTIFKIYTGARLLEMAENNDFNDEENN